MTITLGDNTNAPPAVLARQVLVCAGEDPVELAEALTSNTDLCLDETHNYRCYRFWKCASRQTPERWFTLVWTGIGTGCMEPLLHEILAEGTPVSEIILIGTAGQIASVCSGDPSSEVFAMVEAQMGPTALSALGERHGLTSTMAVAAPPAVIFSTDLYYLWNQRTIGQWATASEFREAWERAQFIDMEVAQFYWLCRRFAGDRLRYAAVKGPANMLGVIGQQTKNSRQVLRACAIVALRTFDIPVNWASS